MPIKNALWRFTDGQDLHVLKGQSTPDLSAGHLLFVKLDNKRVFAKAYLADQTNAGDVTLEFNPLIKGVLAGDVFSGGGVRVDKKTGVVTALNPLPARRLRNFIILAEVTNTADGKKYSLPIRIHVHESVTHFWLTPGTLTIRPNGATRPDVTRYKFSARAQFDDGTVGDLTENHRIGWGPGSLFNDSVEIVLRPGDNPGDPPITVTAHLPASLGGATATGRVRIARPWGDPVTAEIVPGGGWPGTINPAVVPNVLFIGDGFVAADEARFKSLANSVVERFKTNHLTTPFDKLATSMNFWRVFLPSDARGISVLCEVFTETQQGELRGFMVPNPRKPPAAGAWKLEHVIYAAGLPVRADLPENAARTDALIKEDWAALLDPDPSPNVPAALLLRWRKLGNRSLVEEHDSPLCLAYGRPPQAHEESDDRLINFHHRRLRRQRDPNNEDQSRFDRFLAGIGSSFPLDLGALWAERARVRPSNYDFIFILSNCKWDRGINRDGYISMNVSDKDYITGIATVAGRNAYQWTPPEPPNAISAIRSGRGLHEIAHSFGLGDEYAGDDPAAAFTGTAAELDRYGNLQKEDDTHSGGQIDGDQIKWNWHRVRKGALVRATVTPTGADRWLVTLKQGHGGQFAKGDKVFLRKRTFPRPLPGSSRMSTQLSSILEVLEPPNADQLVVKGTLPIGVSFGEGDVLYMPVDAPASVRSPTYPFAELVAKNVKQFITDNHRPLSKLPCSDPANLLSVQVPELDGLAVPLAAADKPRIVGLYSGGSELACGIFHPAGSCMMRGRNLDTLEFCAVCRYIMVDIIDPFIHFEMDRAYEKFYPQP